MSKHKCRISHIWSALSQMDKETRLSYCGRMQKIAEEQFAEQKSKIRTMAATGNVANAMTLWSQITEEILIQAAVEFDQKYDNPSYRGRGASPPLVQKSQKPSSPDGTCLPMWLIKEKRLST